MTLEKEITMKFKKITTEWDKAPNRHGHSADLGFKVPPETKSKVEEIVESRAFPYVSVSHLMRHALWRHLNWLEAKKVPGRPKVKVYDFTLDTETPEHP